MPGGKIAKEDAEYLIEWLELITKQLRRRADKG